MIHVVLSRHIDFVQIAAAAAADRSPTHVLLELARQTPVTFHAPEAPPYQLVFAGNGAPATMPAGPAAPVITHIDVLRSKLISRPELWALARHATAFAAAEDTILATGEDVGIPLAAAGAARHRGRAPRLLMTVHNINRPRARIAFRFFDTINHVSMWLAPAQAQAAYLRTLGIDARRIQVPPEQTDVHFFAPAFSPRTLPQARSHAPGAKPRPLIVSVGLEQRDYRTLAAATADMDLEVKISGFSRDAQAMSSAFPETLPANMTRQFYEWPALRELYQQATLVVVPLFPNRYVAGVNSLLEALACEKPVIISRTEGMTPYLEPRAAVGDVCVAVAPQNPAALRGSIEQLLASPATAEKLALQGRQWVLGHHTPARWVAAITEALAATSATLADSPAVAARY